VKQLIAFLVAVCWPVLRRGRKRSPAQRLGNNNDFLGIQTIRLWPGDAPQAKGKPAKTFPL
jgi:hypothetical protein